MGPEVDVRWRATREETLLSWVQLADGGRKVEGRTKKLNSFPSFISFRSFPPQCRRTRRGCLLGRCSLLPFAGSFPSGERRGWIQEEEQEEEEEGIFELAGASSTGSDTSTRSSSSTDPIESYPSPAAAATPTPASASSLQPSSSASLLSS